MTLKPAHFKTLREALGWGREDVARVMGVSARTVRRWESTSAPPADVERWITREWEAYTASLREVLDRLDGLEGEVVGPVRLTRARGGEGADEAAVAGAGARLRDLVLLLNVEGYAVEVDWRPHGLPDE